MRYQPVDPSQAFPELEQRVLARWRERDVARQASERTRTGATFVVYEGPPTANGAPGVHHVLTRVLKDVYVRYRQMRGEHVRRGDGWDCHGLPVELEIEKQLGLTSKQGIEEFGVAEFNALCRQSVVDHVTRWKRLTERIGFWTDESEAYYTFTDDYIESVWWSLKQVFDQGLLTEGHKVVPYCPRCGTALSSHEVAQGYRELVDQTAWVRFPLRGEPGVSFLSWTTQPWTLVANAALAVNPDVTYVRAQVDGETLILAADLVERVLGPEVAVERPVLGSELVGTAYEPPFAYLTDFGPSGHTVLPADYVTTDEGTAIVHNATAFGEDDFALGQRHGIAVENPVRPNGTFDERIEAFAGRYVKDTDADVVDALRASGRLFRTKRLEHSYPHCWRCDTPLIYYAKTSWYVRTTERRDELLAANESVDWQPEHIKGGRFGNWLENNVDWALSRERYWGTPLPIWRADEDGEVVCIGSRDELRALGAEVPDDLHRPYVDEVTFERDGKIFRRVPDLIDVWWDSGCMPFAQFHAPFENEELFAERFPADYLGEGIDQTRGWFYTLLAISTMIFGRSPYKAVQCFGLVQDGEGQKMSKSRGNVVVPDEVIDTHGADALRWYYASKQPWDGQRYSDEAVTECVRGFLKVLWQTYGFLVLYANVNDVPRDADGDRTEMDRWALSRVAGTVEVVNDRMASFDVVAASRAIAEVVDELSNWYVRRSRRRFWDGDPAAVATLRECLVTVAKLLAPVTPFVADEIYANLDGSEASVHLCDFPEPGERDERLEWQMQVTRDVVELGRAARAHSKVRLRQPLRKAVVVASERERAAIAHLETLVLEELNVKGLEYVVDAEQLGEFTPKPNYKVLGPRFRDEMPQVAAAVAALDPVALRAGAAAVITVGGREHELGPDDVQLVLQPLAGYHVQRSGAQAVALDLDLDVELLREGIVRDVVQVVQAARKSAGVALDGRIALMLDGDAELLAAIREHEAYLMGEALAVELSYGPAARNGFERSEVAGRELLVSLETRALQAA